MGMPGCSAYGYGRRLRYRYAGGSDYGIPGSSLYRSARQLRYE